MVGNNHNLEGGTALTDFDYAYLKADTTVFPCWGACMSVVHEFIQGAGYGEWGRPSPRGQKAMERYERQNMG